MVCAHDTRSSASYKTTVVPIAVTNVKTIHEWLLQFEWLTLQVNQWNSQTHEQLPSVIS